MRLLLRWLKLCLCWRCSKRSSRTLDLWSYGRLLLKSLYFNVLTSSDTALDCVFEPIFWLVDSMSRWFGVVFVSLVILLTGSVVTVVYLCMLPVIFSSYPLHWILWHLCYGHWNLLMILFHYYKATTTCPGFPPQEKSDIPAVTICKKCIVPKPARTHHCSVCSRCILKMDHHCPWLNNCVGHFNQRYFFSFCLFMSMGCIYCSISVKDMFLHTHSAIQSSYQTPAPAFAPQQSLLYLWVLTSSVSVVLGALTLWHAALITKGQTSVERHINRRETTRLGLQGRVFRNPYHRGVINNWKIFFGVEKQSDWLTRVLLPSSHLPLGDGLTWDRNRTVTI
ncbi:palmitoyltransferase ZDHHC16B-like [Cyprinus carpio]|uniref:Palmitoyltransferase n=1 Tax=Cyprinus carpio TaxID=7962 RepID=A0A9Q9V6E3_CYPCA|nr:palmitoyltransferase ZDHHC16B-like [Cyprinus carpio]